MHEDVEDGFVDLDNLDDEWKYVNYYEDYYALSALIKMT